MSIRLLKFAGQWGVYEFPDQTSGNDNFLELVADAQRLPGVDGGYDKYATRRANQAIGNVNADWWLHKGNSDMSTLRAAVGAMAGWGKQRLFTNVWPGSREDKRWTWARVNNLQMNENVQTRPDQQQKVQSSFQVADPGWKGGQRLWFLDSAEILDDGWYLDGKWYLDEGISLDSGYYLNGPKLYQQANSGDTFTVTNRGNRTANATLTIGALADEWALGDGIVLGDGHYLDGGGQPVSNITISFSANGKIDSSFSWGETLESGEVLIVDSETQSVKVRGRTDRSGYTAFQRLAGTGFIRVPPGDSTITISGGIGTLGCKLTLEFWDEYYTS